MSETVDRELKILVERVVRPLPIPLARQKRLRTEFLAHLQAIYAEELARDGDAVSALSRAKERFGDPSRLTVDLLSTIHWWEPLQAWWQRVFAQRLDESLVVYVMKIVAGSLPIFLMLMSLRIASCVYRGYLTYHGIELPGAREGFLFSWQQEFSLIGGFLLSITMWLFAYLYLSLCLGSEWLRPKRRWGPVFGLALITALTTPIFLEILALRTGPLWSEQPVLRQAAWIVGASLVFFGHQFGMVHYRETNYRREWAELELAET